MSARSRDFDVFGKVLKSSEAGQTGWEEGKGNPLETGPRERLLHWSTQEGVPRPGDRDEREHPTSWGPAP